MFADVLFSLKISAKSRRQKKFSLFAMRPLIFSEALHFLQGPRLQPAQPIRKSGTGLTVVIDFFIFILSQERTEALYIETHSGVAFVFEFSG